MSLLFLTLLSALAYETDNLTDRHLPLPDITEALDAEVNRLIGLAIEEVNDRYGCTLTALEAHRVLAHEIYVLTGVNDTPESKKGIASMGYDKYGAWIEDADLPRRSFEDRRDVLGSVTLVESPILKLAGVCSVVRVNGVDVGIDKLEHFFEEGYMGWRRSGYGKRPEAQIRWATRTENTIYGLHTSHTFSFADLRADYDGAVFFGTLMDPWTGVATLDDAGCLATNEPFTWSRWVTWEYDEVLNPPVHTEVTQRAVERHLEAHRDRYCASYAIWGDDAYRTHLERVLAERPEYAHHKAPPRTDPYQLDALCVGWSPPD